MQSKSVQILSTKVLDDVLLAKASDHGINISCLPFIETRSVRDKDILQTIGILGGRPITAIFTSSKSVTEVAALLTQKVNWNIYSLFGATKEQVQLHFPQSVVHATAADSAALAGEMLKDGIAEAYFFCGDKRMDTIPEKLAGKIDLKQLIVYTTHDVAHKIEQHFDGFLFFSPSAVKSFVSVNAIDATTACFAVGSTTAESLRPYTQNITVAAVASGQAMLDKVLEKFRDV